MQEFSSIEREDGVERAREEEATLGFTLSVDHPITVYQPSVPDHPVVPAALLARWVGQQVALAGVVVTERRHRTAQGTTMGFLSLCDASGVAELTLFGRAFERARATLEHHRMVVATGTVTAHEEHGLGLEVRTLRPVRA